MDLSIQQFRIVLAVHDAESFTDAAARLHLTQSSISRTVREVELRLGVRLFERSTRSLVSTSEGAEFTRIARNVVAAFDAGVNHFEGFLAGERGRVRIAALPSLAAILLPPVISSFRRRKPDVDVSIEDCLADEVLERVRSGAVDLAVTGTTDPETDLVVHPIADDQFCCVYAPEHRFAARDRLGWEGLSGEPYIAFDPNSSIRRHADRTFHAEGVSPETVLEARTVAAVAGLVAAGVGVTVVPGLVLPLISFADLRHHVLEPHTSREIAIIRSPDRPLSPTAREFIDELHRARRSTAPLPPEANWLPG